MEAGLNWLVRKIGRVLPRVMKNPAAATDDGRDPNAMPT